MLQPEEGVAEAWRSVDGLTWDPLALPADLGTVSDVVTLRGELALITDEVRSADAWSFDLWTTDDGADWRPVGPTSFEPHPDLLDRPRTILGFRSVEGGFVAFEAYAATGSDASTPQASPRPEAESSRVFVWRTSDGRDWERHEVEGLGRDVIGAGSRILEGAREQLYTVQPGFPPDLLVSADGTTWADTGALVHALQDPEGATDIEPAGDDLLIVGRTHDPEPGTEEWAVFRGAPDGHWLQALTIPGVEAVELVVDRKVGIIAGTASASGDGAVAGPTHSFLASSVDRGRTWQEQSAMGEQDLCLGPLASIGDMALLGAGCPPSGGMSILAARLDAFDPATEPPPSTTVPRAPRALECDFKGFGADSGPGVYGEGERGVRRLPRTAMRAFNREASVIPQSGYRELARDETAVLYGYEHKGEGQGRRPGGGRPRSRGRLGGRPADRAVASPSTAARPTWAGESGCGRTAGTGPSRSVSGLPIATGRACDSCTGRHRVQPGPCVRRGLSCRPPEGQVP